MSYLSSHSNLKAPRFLFAAAMAAVSAHHALAGPITSADTKDKVITPAANDDRSGFYISAFGGANVYQSADPKHINVADARAQPTGTAAEIAAFRATPGNDIPAQAKLFTDGTRIQSPTFSTDIDNFIGYLGGFKFGYEMKTSSLFKPAFEFEGFYNGIESHGTAESNKKLDGIRTSDRDGDELTEPFTNPDAAVPRTHVFVNDLHDQMNAGVFMFNAILKLDLGRVRPYIGAGAGVAYVTHDYRIENLPKGAPAPPSNAAALLTTRFTGKPKYDGGAVARLPTDHSDSQINNSDAGYLDFNSDSEVTFAYQAMLGIEFVLTPRLSAFTEYKAVFYYDGPYYRNLLNAEVTLGVTWKL
jgi:opacity protein-like surface antigen